MIAGILADLGTLLIGLAASGTLFVTINTRRDTKALKAEFKPNGGSSLKDAVNRVESKLHSVDARLVAVEEHITRPTGSVPVVKKAPAKTTTKTAAKKGTAK